MQSIGEQLKQAREARKLTIKQAVQATRIRSYYLEALEADDLSTIPSPAQARGFLRLYAEYLGFNLDDLIARQPSDSPPKPEPPAEQSTDSPPASLAAPSTDSPSGQGPAAEPETSPVPPAPVEPEPTPGPPPASQAILNEIGKQLRERRELLSLTIEEIERHTRIRRHHLEKIETGDFDDLPSPVQARGLLNAYASFLDLDAEAILLRFADVLQARRAERQPQPAPRQRKPSPRPLLWLKRFISADLIFGGGMVLLLLGMSIWGAARLLPGSDLPDEPTATEGPSISEVLLASPVSGETPTPASAPTSVSELGTVAAPTDAPPELPPATPTLLIEFIPAPAVKLTVIVLERAYLKVIVDGEVKQEGRVVPGAALTFDGLQRVEVLTGSGAAIQIIYNQQNLGILGSFGEVVNRIYTVNGIETPTPTPSPIPSATPRQSPTPTFTITPPVTNTPLP